MSYIDIRTQAGGQWVKPGRTPVTASAPGGGGGGTVSTLTPHLPINMPDLRPFDGVRYVGAHEFPPYPINEGDYWVTTKTADAKIPASLYEEDGDYVHKHFYPPGREEGINQDWYKDHREYGGYIRNRLEPRRNDSGLTRSASRVKDFETEIGWMVEAYHDVTYLELLEFPSGNNNGAKASDFITAHKNVAPAWHKIILMPDGSASISKSGPDALADQLNAWLNQSPDSFLKINGKYVIAPYGAEIVVDFGQDTLTFWSAVKNRLINVHKKPIFMWFVFSRDWLSTTNGADKIDSISDGLGRWGGAHNPIAANTNDTSNRGAPAHCHDKYAKPWLHFWRPQDNRPSTKAGRVFWEAGNTELFHYTMMAAIDGLADAVQATTWNDDYECSGIGPSIRSGKSWLRLGAYYIARYKTGSWAPVVRDTLYLSHRNQFSTVDATAELASPAQTLFMSNKTPTQAPARDQIEVACFVTSGTSTEVRIYRDPAGGTNYSSTPYQTTAVTVATTSGETITRVKAPLATGTFKAELWRNGSYVPGTRVFSREPVYPITVNGVTTKPKVQDRTYVLSDSGEHSASERAA